MSDGASERFCFNLGADKVYDSSTYDPVCLISQACDWASMLESRRIATQNLELRQQKNPAVAGLCSAVGFGTAATCFGDVAAVIPFWFAQNYSHGTVWLLAGNSFGSKNQKFAASFGYRTYIAFHVQYLIDLT